MFVDYATEEHMEGENRTPDKPIGEIVHAQEQAKRTTGHLPPLGPGAPQEAKAKANQKPEAKKTGEF
jgi:hypothetical protein